MVGMVYTIVWYQEVCLECMIGEEVGADEAFEDIAFTFDDGPYNYTSDLLDKFKAYNATATFFISKFNSSFAQNSTDNARSWK